MSNGEKLTGVYWYVVTTMAIVTTAGKQLSALSRQSCLRHAKRVTTAGKRLPYRRKPLVAPASRRWIVRNHGRDARATGNKSIFLAAGQHALASAPELVLAIGCYLINGSLPSPRRRK